MTIEVRLLDRLGSLRRRLEQVRSIFSLPDDVSRLSSSSAEMADELQAMASQLAAVEVKLSLQVSRADNLARALEDTSDRLTRLEAGVDAALSSAELGDEVYEDLAAYRAQEDYGRLYAEPSLLVSVCIATYNRADLLTQRCLPSVLSQDYPNIEIIVVGDGCTDDTPERVAGLKDARIRFLNLPVHTPHPEEPGASWLMSGGPCENEARMVASGDLIAQLDDDDEYLPGRLTKLVELMKATGAEVAWHPFWWEDAAGNWTINQAPRFELGMVTTGSVMYRAWFSRFRWHPRAYLAGEPSDWYRYRKFKHVGARIARHEEPLLKHYRERNRPYLGA